MHRPHRVAFLHLQRSTARPVTVTDDAGAAGGGSHGAASPTSDGARLFTVPRWCDAGSARRERGARVRAVATRHCEGRPQQLQSDAGVRAAGGLGTSFGTRERTPSPPWLWSLWPACVRLRLDMPVPALFWRLLSYFQRGCAIGACGLVVCCALRCVACVELRRVGT
jgi:hypothetical protein